MLRLPAVAGRFYPADPRELTHQVQKFTIGIAAEEKIAARGCVVPHAGYMYSGAVAGAVYGRLRLPRRMILLGPRHYTQGASLAILSEGAWQTPLGENGWHLQLEASALRAGLGGALGFFKSW